MEKFSISVRKLTDADLMREACEMTFDGVSKQSLMSIYKSEHSPVRTQLFWVTLQRIPLFVATHLIRHHVGSVPFQLTCREDRKGGNVGFKERMADISSRLGNLKDTDISDVQEEIDWLATHADRYTPVNLGLLVNAQSLIDMAKMRLCLQAHKETIRVFKALKEVVRTVDEDLARMMVVKCVYRGGICGEPRCCGWNKTKAFQKELSNYLECFTDEQVPNKYKILNE